MQYFSIIRLVFMVKQNARTRHVFQQNVQIKMFSVFYGYGSRQDKALAQKNVQGKHWVGWDIFLEVFFVPALG